MVRLGVAFVAGGVAGALLLRWYIMTHPGEIVGDVIADKLGLAKDGAGRKFITGVGGIIDQQVVQ
jgi:hypothetical protein